MSSIFSDPGWRRGTTLLSGELIEYSDAPNNTIPTAGQELVGQMKIFQDVSPYTGIRYSNHLVYCVAARYKGTTTLTSADAGKVFVFDREAPLTQFSTLAQPTDITDGRLIGVLDEYLTVSVRTNDIVWLVVSGPTSVSKNPGIVVPISSAIEVSTVVSTTTSAVANTAQAVIAVTSATGVVEGMAVSGTNIPTGAVVKSISSNNVTLDRNITTQVASSTAVTFGAYGQAAIKTAYDNLIGVCIATPAYVKTGTASSASTALTVTDATGLLAGQAVSGTGIATGTYIDTIVGTAVTLSKNTSAAITTATSLYFGGSLRSDSLVRVNMAVWKP
jgi:hypothetical protein